MLSRHQRGLADTSVIVDLRRLSEEMLPTELAVSAITLAELAAGPHATTDPAESAVRQRRLRRTGDEVEVLPFDEAAAHAFGRVYAAVLAAGRKARGRRSVDLLIAAQALAADLPLYTKNPDDFTGLEELVEIVGIPSIR